APNSLPPAEIALPGRSITQLTVLPVAFAAVPAMVESDENTLAAKPRGRGSGSLSDGGFTVTGRSVVGAVVPVGIGADCAEADAGGATAPEVTTGAATVVESGRARAIVGRAAGNGAAAGGRSGSGLASTARATGGALRATAGAAGGALASTAGAAGGALASTAGATGGALASTAGSSVSSVVAERGVGVGRTSADSCGFSRRSLSIWRVSPRRS